MTRHRHVHTSWDAVVDASSKKEAVGCRSWSGQLAATLNRITCENGDTECVVKM